MKAVVFVLAFLVGSTAQAQVNTLSFTGKVVDSNQTTPLTKVVPETTTHTDGTMTTQYVVYSQPTGDRLASFDSNLSAQEYAATVTPSVAYRSP